MDYIFRTSRRALRGLLSDHYVAAQPRFRGSQIVLKDMVDNLRELQTWINQMTALRNRYDHVRSTTRKETEGANFGSMDWSELDPMDQFIRPLVRRGCCG
jgi:hypothetical protein